MRGIVLVRRAVVLSVVLLAGGGIGLAAGSLGEEEVLTPPAPDSNFPAPDIGTLTEPYYALSPPGSDSRPNITGSAAVEVAETLFGPAAFPTRVVARLAQDQGGRLVWAIFFEGICMPVLGPPERTSAAPDVDGGRECSSDGLVVTVDALTGVPDEGMGGFHSLPT